MNEKDMTKNSTNNLHDESSQPESSHISSGAAQDSSSTARDSSNSSSILKGSKTTAQPDMPQDKTKHADILVINYGENYDADSYLPPEDHLTDQYTEESHAPSTKPAKTNPDDEEEIEFEKFLRLFKEKTRQAAQKTKVAAHNLRQNSLIRFAHWVSPKLDPYREMTLPKRSTKAKFEARNKAKSATESAVEPAVKASSPQDVLWHGPEQEAHQDESREDPKAESSEFPAETSQQACTDTKELASEGHAGTFSADQDMQVSSPSTKKSASTVSTSESDFELAEAAPYVPKSIGEFLNLMRRTPKDVISPRERHVIATIMNFPNVKVSEIMQPAENITYVNYEEVLGPLTLDRLYRAGYDHFPVVDNRHKIIGLIHTTALNSLEIKETSRAGDLLDPKVYYVREDYTLNQALAAFLRTNCYFFLVIDRYEKIVGLLTYQMLVNYLLGETPEDDFYRDEDRLAVAKRKLP